MQQTYEYSRGWRGQLVIEREIIPLGSSWGFHIIWGLLGGDVEVVREELDSSQDI